MHVTFCAVEAAPFAQTGGLGEVCGSLPLALAKKGVATTIFLPRHKSIDFKKFSVETLDRHLSRMVLSPKLDVYFIEHDYFGKRDGIYGDGHGDYPDNLERFQYYCAQVLKVIVERHLKTNILHCHDWHAALIPVYLREHYRHSSLSSVKDILTIHNMAHQGIFPKEKYPHLHLREALHSPHHLEYFGQINFLKGGIVFSDKVTTVSPQYAKEILTKEFGCGLQGVVRARHEPVVGILNGINYDVWNPATDHLIAQRYAPKEVTEGKTVNKARLQEALCLPVGRDIPLFALVSRIVHQKGVDLILDSMEQLMGMDIQLVMLGAGESRYEKKIRVFANQHPQQLWANFKFDESLAHQIYAGADWFLMPSRFEPCGLSQMISMMYGTIPIAFKTGGLVDTVAPFDAVDLKGNGLLFEHFTKKDFLHVVRQAVTLYRDQEKFHALRHNALAVDFSWEHAAKEYIKVYQCLLSA